VENFFLGLELLRSLGYWNDWRKNHAPKWDNGFLTIPCYFRSCSKEAKENLEALGFSWSITGMLRYPIEQGRLI